MALRINQLEEIQSLLRLTPALIDRYDARDVAFPAEVALWLKRLELALQENRMHVVSFVAQLRGVLLAAQRGHRMEGVEIQGRPSRRRLAEAAAIRAVREASGMVSDAIATRSEQVDEAGKLARQILSIAALKQSVLPCMDSTDHQARMSCIQSTIQQDADLLPYYAALTGLVAKQDAQVLLDRALEEVGVGG